MTQPTYARVALNRPLDKLFHYALPEGTRVEPGQRVLVPFGRERIVGIILELTEHPDIEHERVRPILALLDPEPVLDAHVLGLLRFTARYYHHAIGETVAHALPPALRLAKPLPADTPAPTQWRLCSAAPSSRIGPRQQRILDVLGADTAQVGLTRQAISEFLDKPVREIELRRLLDLGVLETVRSETVASITNRDAGDSAPETRLTCAQLDAIQQINAARGQPQVFLLDGITGSGKTEVYLEATRRVLESGEQVLFMVPEIALTPQTIARVNRYFPNETAALHSGLPAGERLRLWNAVRTGRRAIVLGTRSTIFVPLPRLGLIIVDEEHDAAYKQQDGLRYNARDLAIFRGHAQRVPVVLGSATPTLESWHRAREGRYQGLHLATRPDGSQAPGLQTIDTRVHRRDEGLSRPLLAAMQETLDHGRNCLLLLNRRGFAHTLTCAACGWIADCPRCDARLTVHVRQQRSICHHCGHQQKLLHHCPQCGSALAQHGTGTERLEHALAEHFPGRPLLRMDRDNIRTRGALESIIEAIRNLQGGIVVGTQMLAKGHDFARIGLVGVIDVDQGLFSVDLRAAEQTVQLVQQAAGRAGRDGSPATVWLQTAHPDHPLIAGLMHGDYGAIASALLNERRRARMPPFGHVGLVRFDANTPESALTAATDLAERLRQKYPELRVLGPAPAPRHRVNLRYREQILLATTTRGLLHRALDDVAEERDTLNNQRHLRIGIDVDPQTLS
jgi:primosomal protein N' (replication factor Y)